MAVYARYGDGMEVDARIFKVLAKYAPDGVMDVFASDQHNSYVKLLDSFFKRIGKTAAVGDDDVREVCRRFARNLKKHSTASLFNHLLYGDPGFKKLVGRKMLLIGRLEDTNAISVDGGKGKLAQLAVQPEDVADRVDAFKTLVYLNPDHKESWEKNRAWLSDIFDRCRKLGKPLYNETLLLDAPGETKAQKGRKLPEALILMARDFSPYGHFYKTQVPLLWVEEGGKVERISDVTTIRDVTIEMERLSPRPLLLLSAAVDFEQYTVQYGTVADLVSGPMCGRAYFKEAFNDPKAKDWNSLEKTFKRIALPRIELIRSLARVLARPWWYKFTWMHEKARKRIQEIREVKPGVQADKGY